MLVDADDVDTWMLDILRLVSSDDTGKDEANVQTLLKKHKEISDELKNYESTIKALHDQADALGEDDRESRTGNISVSGFRFIGISSIFLPFFDEKYFIYFYSH